MATDKKPNRYLRTFKIAIKWNYNPKQLFWLPRTVWERIDEVGEAFLTVFVFLLLPIFVPVAVLLKALQPLWYPFTCKHTDEELDIAEKHLKEFWKKKH